MGFDIGVLGDDYRFIKTLHMDPVVKGALFRKLVTPEGYPALGKAADDSEDLVFGPGDLPGLVGDIDGLMQYLAGEKLMSAEVKERCGGFLTALKEICLIAQSEGKNVDFISGD